MGEDMHVHRPAEERDRADVRTGETLSAFVPTLDASARARLLDLAEAAIVARVLGGIAPVAPADLDVPMSGVFVSLHRAGDLRGCLGTLHDDEPLAAAVARLGAAVVCEDPRFPPVSGDELNGLLIEISVLSPRRPLTSAGEIVIGRHGVTVEKGWRRALLLPQVADELGWDAHRLLAQTCLKAGLPEDAWRTGAHVCTFEADVFGRCVDRAVLDVIRSGRS